MAEDTIKTESDKKSAPAQSSTPDSTPPKASEMQKGDASETPHSQTVVQENNTVGTESEPRTDVQPKASEMQKGNAPETPRSQTGVRERENSDLRKAEPSEIDLQNSQRTILGIRKQFTDSLAGMITGVFEELEQRLQLVNRAANLQISSMSPDNYSFASQYIIDEIEPLKDSVARLRKMVLSLQQEQEKIYNTLSLRQSDAVRELSGDMTTRYDDLLKSATSILKKDIADTRTAFENDVNDMKMRLENGIADTRTAFENDVDDMKMRLENDIADAGTTFESDINEMKAGLDAADKSIQKDLISTQDMTQKIIRTMANSLLKLMMKDESFSKSRLDQIHSAEQLTYSKV